MLNWVNLIVVLGHLKVMPQSSFVQNAKVLKLKLKSISALNS